MWFQSFTNGESGAVSVDWVVITATVIAFQVVLLVGQISDAMMALNETTVVKIDSIEGLGR